MNLKILSWNIWERCNFEELKDFLAKSKADIIGLQEVLIDDPTRDVVGFLKGLGYECAVGLTAEVKMENNKIITINNGVFSKYPIIEKRLHSLSDKGDRGATEAVVKIGDKNLHVFSLHLKHTHQQPSDFQNIQADNLIKALPREKTVVMGDFNATPESYAVKIFTLSNYSSVLQKTTIAIK